MLTLLPPPSTHPIPNQCEFPDPPPAHPVLPTPALFPLSAPQQPATLLTRRAQRTNLDLAGKAARAKLKSGAQPAAGGDAEWLIHNERSIDGGHERSGSPPRHPRSPRCRERGRAGVLS